MNIETIFAAVVVSGVAILGASQASAMPMAPEGVSAPIEMVTNHCHPGYHRSSSGRCMPDSPPFDPRPYSTHPFYRDQDDRHDDRRRDRHD